MRLGVGTREKITNRLVDKDVLEDAVQGAINIMESQGISMITASVPLAIIKGAPTVNAIPLEWLRKVMMNDVNDPNSSEAAFQIFGTVATRTGGVKFDRANKLQWFTRIAGESYI